jgi:hypothetical protein
MNCKQARSLYIESPADDFISKLVWSNERNPSFVSPLHLEIESTVPRLTQYYMVTGRHTRSLSVGPSTQTFKQNPTGRQLIDDPKTQPA